MPAPDHRLTLSLFGSPSSGEGVRAGVGGDVAVADPAWMRETVVRNTTDVGLHWISKLYDRKWQIEANIGVHREYFNNYSPDPGAQQPQSAGVVGRQPVGPGANPRAASRKPSTDRSSSPARSTTITTAVSAS